MNAIYTNMTLTNDDRDVIIECLKDYRDITLDSAGDVNIMGIEDTDPAGTPCKETHVWKVVDELITHVQQNCLTGDDLTIIYSCFDDALDQYDVANGECGFIQSEEANDQVRSIYNKLKHNSVKQLLLDKQDILPVIADALLGSIGADIGCIEQDTWQLIHNYGKKIMPVLTDSDLVMAWAMVLTNIRDIHDANNLDRIYDEIDLLDRALNLDSEDAE